MKLGIGRTKKEHKIKGRQYMTIMFITDATKDPKSIRIPKLIRFPVLILIVALALGSMSVYEHLARMEADLASKALETQTANIESSNKEQKIAELNEELTYTKEEQSKQLLELQKKAAQLGLQLVDLEKYTDSMAEFKDLIDSNLSGSESKDDGALTGNGDDSISLQMSPDDVFAGLSTSSLSDVSVESSLASDFGISSGISSPMFNSGLTALKLKLSNDSVDVENIDFQEEISGLNDYLDTALGLTGNEEDTFETTSEQLEEMIPYVEAYPSILPIADTKVTSPFGYRKNPFGGYSTEFHSGVDLQAYYEPVVATGGGTVVKAGYNSAYGYMILIDHGYGIMTRYGHNQKLYVSVGDIVKRGDIISKSGNSGRSTGPHLHYEVIVNGQVQNPLDFVYNKQDESTQ